MSMKIYETPVRVVSTTARIDAEKGIQQVINYCQAGRNRMTEVVTELLNGAKDVKRVYYDQFGVFPQCVVLNSEGKIQVFRSALPENAGVLKEVGERTEHIPTLSLEELAII